MDCLKEAKRTAYRGFFGRLSEDKVPLMNIVLAGKPVQALTDLGASGCIIDLEMCRMLPDIIIDTTRAIRMQLVAGETMAFGETIINLKWAGGWVVQNFVVVSCANQTVILGRDFMRGAALILDVEKGMWTSRKVPGVVTPYEAPMRVFSARVIEMDEWRGLVDISDCTAVHKPLLLGLLEHYLDLFKFKPGGAIGFFATGFAPSTTLLLVQLSGLKMLPRGDWSLNTLLTT